MIRKNKSTYKALRTKEQLKAEVARWAEVIKVKPVQVRFQRMKLKWASCSPKGWISFSMDLIHEPRVFQEYVIVHELLHLQVPNHGRLFKSLMNAYLPKWENVFKRESFDYTLWQRDLLIERSIEDTSKTAMKRK